MAGKQRAIFLYFNMEDEADCGLYLKLAGTLLVGIGTVNVRKVPEKSMP